MVSRYNLRATIVLVAVGSLAQSNAAKDWKDIPVPDSDDNIEALAGKWDIRCSTNGCLMFTDLQHLEYITIAVAIERQTKRPD